MTGDTGHVLSQLRKFFNYRYLWGYGVLKSNHSGEILRKGYLMKQRKFLIRLFVIFIVCSLFLLAMHNHPFGYGHEHDDDHCMVCQIAGNGFVASEPFLLILFRILIITVSPHLKGIITAVWSYGYCFRAPPANRSDKPYSIIILC